MKITQEKFDLLAKIIVPLHVFKSIFNGLNDGVEPDMIDVKQSIKREIFEHALLFNEHLQATKHAMEAVSIVHHKILLDPRREKIL